MPNGEFLELAAREPGAKFAYYLESNVVPGLLQTEAYARAVVGVWGGADADEVVRFRLGRQRRVNLAPCHFLIAEAVLWRRFGGDEVMAGQFKRLSAMADGGVDIRVIPSGVGMWLEQVILLDGSLLHLERLDGDRNYTDPVVVGEYRRMIDLAYAHSVDIREFLS